MSDRHEASEDMFKLPPVSMLRMPPCEEEAGGAGGEGFAGGDQDTESEIGETEEDASLVLVPSGLESSSTGGAASNLLYLSDQVSLKVSTSQFLCSHLSVYCTFVLCPQDSSENEDLDSGGDDVSILDYRVEEEGLLESHPTHRSTTQDSHWALPSSHTSSHHQSHHHHHHHHSARLSRSANSSHRWAWHWDG